MPNPTDILRLFLEIKCSIWEDRLWLPIMHSFYVTCTNNSQYCPWFCVELASNRSDSDSSQWYLKFGHVTELCTVEQRVLRNIVFRRTVLTEKTCFGLPRTVTRSWQTKSCTLLAAAYNLLQLRPPVGYEALQLMLLRMITFYKGFVSKRTDKYILSLEDTKEGNL